MERNIAKLVDLDKEEIDSKPNEHQMGDLFTFKSLKSKSILLFISVIFNMVPLIEVNRILYKFKEDYQLNMVVIAS